jgi:hypothetical protein
LKKSGAKNFFLIRAWGVFNTMSRRLVGWVEAPRLGKNSLRVGEINCILRACSTYE